MKTLRGTLVPIALVAALGAAACSSGGDLGATAGGGDDYNPGGTTIDAGAGKGDDFGSADAGTPVPPGTMIYSGRYTLTSTVDLAGAGAFGALVSDTLVQLSQFHENPAGTILDLLAIYQLPYYTEVWNILPGFIKQPFEGWLNNVLFAALFQAVPAVEQAFQFVDDVASVTRNAQLNSEMVLGALAADGTMKGTHTLKSLGFTLFGNTTIIPFPADIASLLQLPVTGTVNARNGLPGGAVATLMFDKQEFGFPYGDMAMDAIKQMVFVPAGATDLASYLNVLIDCTAVGVDLGNQCVAGKCIHDFVSADQLAGMCREGLDTVGNEVETKVRSLRLDLVDFEDGRCLATDIGGADQLGDGKISAFTQGQWTATIHLDGGDAHVMSPFTAVRTADQ